MLRIFKTIDGVTKQLDQIEENVWINLTNPSPEEIAYVARETGIETSDMKASLDDEEASRIELENKYTLV